MSHFNWGFTVDELYRRDGLQRLDQLFLGRLRAADGAVAARLEAARAAPKNLAAAELSKLLLDLCPLLEEFLIDLFQLGAEAKALAVKHHDLAPVFEIKRNFVQRIAVKQVKPDAAAQLDGGELRARLEKRLGEPLSELAFAAQVAAWLKDAGAHGDDLRLARDYAAWATLTPQGRHVHGGGVLFKAPEKVEAERLIRPLKTAREYGVARHELDPSHWRRREGFALTDPGTDLTGALDQAHYCIWCHHQGKDSCSTGLREKAPAGAKSPAPFKNNSFGVKLAGCPLEEKISEMHVAKVAGWPLAALAIVTVDNPMVPATGHRICNDCMKSCIYQKQDPVNIPQAETRVLKDVLELPWGFEIYSLLTRWNPLNVERPLPCPPSGRRALVVGMGPAGFTLAHHLLNEGHSVTGIDGLKIEPLAAELNGVGAAGARVPFAPIRDARELYESLDERTMAGFGGVAEYGITVRWDKNFLKLVRLVLERREHFALYGGVRFGGTLGVDEAFAQGFDHVALAMGAGGPTVLDLPNGLARGVRAASDFLMALQLTGAAKADSIANMQLRLPVVVVGGGLTGIDTATEALAYYPVQVEKFLRRYEALAADKGEAAVRAPWDKEECLIADEFIGHGRLIRAERAQAAAENRAPRILELLRSWGGVTLAYRRRLIDSPAYTLNHEEVEKALEEGIVFAEELAPTAVEVDEFGHARALRMKRAGGGEIEMPARAILVAAGTQPNTVLAREDKGHVRRHGRSFAAVGENGQPVTPEERNAKPGAVEVLVHRTSDGRAVSFFGDLHPSYFGSVVKAMGSAKQGYPIVSRLMNARPPASAVPEAQFRARIDDDLRPRVHQVTRLTPTIVEVVVRAPLAARQFRPGQFYRLQNFDTLAPVADGTRLAMEGLAMTGAWVDKERGLVAVIVLEMGGSSDICALLRPGEPVVLMGPTGSASEIPGGQTVLLAGGGLGNAVLFSIGKALRAAGSRVLYFAGYRRPGDRYKVAEIEEAADVIVWACDEGPAFSPGRPQDRAFTGNIVRAMEAYAEGRLGPTTIALSEVERILAIGSDRMMAAVAAARHGVLAPFLRPDHVALGSINSPMQCMMKEICAQCLQPHVDPKTGARSCVFSCFDQDQPLDRVDWAALAARLRQNSVQEKLTRQWIDRCLVAIGARRRAA